MSTCMSTSRSNYFDMSIGKNHANHSTSCEAFFHLRVKEGLVSDWGLKLPAVTLPSCSPSIYAPVEYPDPTFTSRNSSTDKVGPIHHRHIQNEVLDFTAIAQLTGKCGPESMKKPGQPHFILGMTGCHMEVCGANPALKPFIFGPWSDS